MLTFSTSMIIAVVCIIIGLGIGMMISMAFNSRGNQNKPSTSKTAEPYEDIAHILRDRQTSDILTEFEGRIYASSQPLNDTQRASLESTARDWYKWLLLPPEPEIEKPTPVKPENATVSHRVSAAMPRSTTPLPEPIPEPTDPRSTPLRVPGLIPSLVAAAVASNNEKVRPAPAKSIVQQIDDILQEMVAGTPLVEKSIRLVDEPTHGVIVWIGLEHFEGINNVPDLEVRTIIQAAVREWEKRSEVKPK
jgi:hypothetical protein